jgi:hypothetical protein
VLEVFDFVVCILALLFFLLLCGIVLLGGLKDVKRLNVEGVSVVDEWEMGERGQWK